MSSENMHSPPSHSDPSAEIARLKRRLLAAQDEVQELTSRKIKKQPSASPPSFLTIIIDRIVHRTTITLGRGIRRLVTLYDSLDDLLQAADDAHGHENEDSNEEPNESTHEQPLTEEELIKKQEYLHNFHLRPVVNSKAHRSANQFTSFKLLLKVIPSVGKVISDPAADVDMYLAQVGFHSWLSFLLLRLSCLIIALLSYKRAQTTLAATMFVELKRKSQCGSIRIMLPAPLLT